MEEEIKIEDLDQAEETVGNVSISEEVVSIVVGMTLSEVKGIFASGNNLGSIAEMFSGKKNMGKGVKVTLKGETVSIDLHVVVEYGVRIPDVAFLAQEKVKESVEMITGLIVEKVNIHVEGVNIEKEPKIAKKPLKEGILEELSLEEAKSEEEIFDKLEDDMNELKEIEKIEE